jgi:hypothetical protein
MKGDQEKEERKQKREEKERFAKYKVDFFSPKKRKKAFEVALEERAREYDLYWRRATYGWTILAAIFAGYFLLAEKGGLSPVIVAGLGFLFSVGWYCTNRGSAAWLRNWEIHVELLEDTTVGPLFKSVMARKSYKWWKVWLPYPYSTQRLNVFLSLACIVVWVPLAILSLLNISQIKDGVLKQIDDVVFFERANVIYFGAAGIVLDEHLAAEVILGLFVVAALFIVIFGITLDPDKYLVITQRQKRQIDAKAKRQK